LAHIWQIVEKFRIGAVNPPLADAQEANFTGGRKNNIKKDSLDYI